MTRLVPVGYLTFREAVIRIEHAMFAGIPDRVEVAKLRQSGDDVADGEANQRAVSELWKGVDARKLQPVAIGGHPRQKVKLTAEQTKGIPALRTCGDFSFLRSRNSLYRELVAWFGSILLVSPWLSRNVSLRNSVGYFGAIDVEAFGRAKLQAVADHCKSKSNRSF
jgi:hypothetical protein